ncbi:MAG: hypothetical protein ACR2PT_14870 [Endozoicomonas sp.]
MTGSLVLSLTRRLLPLKGFVSLLLLYTTPPVLSDVLVMDYQVYLIHQDDSFSDLVANPDSFGSFHTGCTRITLDMDGSLRQASLRATKSRQSEARPNASSVPQEVESASALKSLVNTFFTQLSYLTTPSPAPPDQATIDKFDARSHGYEDLSDAPKHHPVPKIESLDWLSTLYSFFLNAPDSARWRQEESEVFLDENWQLIDKSITVFKGKRLVRRSYIPHKDRQDQTQSSGTPNFHFGWNPLADITEVGDGCNADALGARLTGYTYYLSVGTRRKEVLPIYGLPRLYQFTASEEPAKHFLGWFPELLPALTSSASSYDLSTVDPSHSQNLPELFRGSSTPFSRESRLSQSNGNEYFYMYSRTDTNWAVLVWQVGSHRLVMIQTEKRMQSELQPQVSPPCLLSEDDLADDDTPKPGIMKRQ